MDWLKEYADKSEYRILVYMSMTDHMHLLITAEQNTSTGKLKKALGQRYVQYINKRYQHTGTLWVGGYKSCPIQTESYLLTCQRYIELNPVRGNIVLYPAEYSWNKLSCQCSRRSQ